MTNIIKNIIKARCKVIANFDKGFIFSIKLVNNEAISFIPISFNFQRPSIIISFLTIR